VLLNATGRIVEACWRRIPVTFKSVELGSFVVMPNHFHALLTILPPHGLTGGPSPVPSAADGRPHGTTTGSPGAMVQSFKSVAAGRVSRLSGYIASVLWQRN
jgi:hypothetical protein